MAPFKLELVPEVYVVRASGGQWAEAFRRHKYVGTGWSISESLEGAAAQGRDQIREIYARYYPEESIGQIGQNTGQIWRFIHDIKPGMIVLVPTNESTLMVGQVAGPYYYEAFPPAGDSDYRHRLPVQWLSEELPRSVFSVPLQNSLKSLLSVFAIKQAHEVLARLGVAVPDEKKALVLTETALRRAVVMRILELSADEFELLVTELLKAIGFEAEHVGRVGDEGIDVEGKLNVYGFVTVELRVQVKRYAMNATIDTKTIKAFRGSVPVDCQAALVTTADFSQKARIEAIRPKFKQIGLINGEQLVDILVEHYDDLPADLRDKLQLRHTLIPLSE